MDIDYEHLQECLEKSSPIPWDVDYEHGYYGSVPQTTRLLVVDKGLNMIAERQEIRGSDEYARAWANFELMVLAPVLAQEVVRLCDGIELIRDRCETLSETAKEHGLHQLAHEMDINARALAGVLKGSH